MNWTIILGPWRCRSFLKIIYSECYLVLGIGVLYILGLIFLPILMCWSPYFPWIWGKYPIPSYLQIRRLFIWIVPIKKSQCWSCTFSSITKYPFNIKEKKDADLTKKGADLTNFGQEKKGADLTNSRFSESKISFCPEKGNFDLS